MPSAHQLSSESVHTVAIKKDGTLWAWGNNEYGQLGTEDFTNYIMPVEIPCPLSNIENNNTQIELNFYPNPATGSLNVYLDPMLSGIFEYDIVSLSGQLVASDTFSGEQLTISLANLPNGAYQFLLKSTPGRCSKMFEKF